MDYLKSKVVKDSSSSSTEEETDSEETEEESESEEDSDTVETVSIQTEKKGKAKAQKPQQESPAEKKKKGSTLQVLLNYILFVIKQELHGVVRLHWLLQGWDWKLEICKTPQVPALLGHLVGDIKNSLLDIFSVLIKFPFLETRAF